MGQCRGNRVTSIVREEFFVLVEVNFDELTIFIDWTALPGLRLAANRNVCGGCNARILYALRKDGTVILVEVDLTTRTTIDAH